MVESSEWLTVLSLGLTQYMELVLAIHPLDHKATITRMDAHPHVASWQN